MPLARPRARLDVSFDVALAHLAEYLRSSLVGEPPADTSTQTKELESGSVLVTLTKNGRRSTYELSPAGPQHCYVAASTERESALPRVVQEEIDQVSFAAWASSFERFCRTGVSLSKDEFAAEIVAARNRLSPPARAALGL